MSNIQPTEILIKYLDLSDDTKESLKDMGYITLNDLINEKKEKIINIFEPSKKRSGTHEDYLKPFALRELEKLLHYDYGVTFKNEFENMGIPQDIGLIKIDALDLPTAIKTVLKHSGVFTFGDLVDHDYRALAISRNLGTERIQLLKDYVHSLGYTLKNEEPSIDEVT